VGVRLIGFDGVIKRQGIIVDVPSSELTSMNEPILRAVTLRFPILFCCYAIVSFYDMLCHRWQVRV